MPSYKFMRRFYNAKRNHVDLLEQKRWLVAAVLGGLRCLVRWLLDNRAAMCEEEELD